MLASEPKHFNYILTYDDESNIRKEYDSNRKF